MSHTAVGPYTWKDFIDLDEDDPRELLDGHLVEIEVPTLRHERIVHRLTFMNRHRATVLLFN